MFTEEKKSSGRRRLEIFARRPSVKPNTAPFKQCQRLLRSTRVSAESAAHECCPFEELSQQRLGCGLQPSLLVVRILLSPFPPLPPVVKTKIHFGHELPNHTNESHVIANAGPDGITFSAILTGLNLIAFNEILQEHSVLVCESFKPS